MTETKRRQQEKAKIKAAKNAARKLVLTDSKCSLTIMSTVHVQLIEGGAFVEAVIWIPDSRIKEHA